MIAVGAVAIWYFVNPPIEEKPYSQFLQDLRNGKISQVRIKVASGIAVVKERDGSEYQSHILLSENLDRELSASLAEYSVEGGGIFGGGVSSPMTTLLIVGGLTFVFWLLFLRQTQNPNQQAFAFGKSRARVLVDSKPDVTFDDVAGMEEAKQELQEVIDFLRNPEKYRRVGARIPKGVLLMGPPGTGKTLLARAVAGEASVAFIHISGSEFVELFVGVGASRVRHLFQTALLHAPAVLFIDEIDAVGRQRGAGLGGGHDEREQTLNQLLVEMDGFDNNRGVVVLAATNRPDILDPALLRPGRFDRRVVIDRPDYRGRKDILKVHTRNIPLAPDVSLDVLAQRTPGFTGADLANMANEAAILAAREGRSKVTMNHFLEAVERVMAGPQRRSRILTEQEREIVAYHEAGHALLGWLLSKADPVQKISILARGMALGYTLQMPKEDRYLMTRQELLDKLTVLLGGRVAEEIVFGEVSTGAHNDLEELTDLARKMVKDFGMSDKLGPMAFGKKYGEIFLGRDLTAERDYSEETARQIDEEVRNLLTLVYERAKELLSRHKEALEAVAKKLMEQENLERPDFEALMNDLGVARGGAPHLEWPQRAEISHSHLSP
ncbi:MAG: ATP-dependent zinc metalloprotease FtsH [bacterium JZ-2024 1]